METALKAWDGESIIVQHDRPTGALIIIAIHSSRLGPAAGGTRMKSYPDYQSALQDALRLAAGMTYKFAVHNLPRGGAKAVISVSDMLDEQARHGLLLRYGTLIRQLNGLFQTGPDVGTSSEDMDLIAETGAPYVRACTPARGGAGDSGPFTALGLFACLRATCEQLFGTAALNDRHVLVQGAGSVGGRLIEHLLEAGARVSFSDLDPQAISRFRDARGLAFVPAEAVYETECDIFAPCAMGNVLTAATIPRLRCRAVVGAANNQLGEQEDAERLRARGILYAPDYVVNVGGAMALTGLEALGWSEAKARQAVERTGETQVCLYCSVDYSRSAWRPSMVDAGGFAIDSKHSAALRPLLAKQTQNTSHLAPNREDGNPSSFFGASHDNSGCSISRLGGQRKSDRHVWCWS